MHVSPIGLSAALASSLLLATGCARTWPSVRSVGDEGFLAAGGIRTIDLLPLDVGVALGPQVADDADAVADRFAGQAALEVYHHLVGRGYAATFVGPDGVTSRSDGQLVIAMTPDEVEAVQASLATFGTAQAREARVLLTPYLPARLGTVTGSDATLYVGGWAFAGRDRRAVSGADVAKGVLIGVFIVLVVVVAVAMAKKGGGGGGQGGGGGAGRAIGGAGGAAARAIGAGGRAAARGLGRVARTSLHVMRAIHHSPDAWGRHHTHVNLYLAAPAAPPPDTGPSRTVLEMTLVDNRRGLVLWHARQEFPASPMKAEDVKGVVASLMAGLPARR
jgi:hypothetical protein